MSEPRTFVTLTEPITGHAVIHVQKEGGELQQILLTREQLFALNAKSAEILMKGQGK